MNSFDNAITNSCVVWRYRSDDDGKVAREPSQLRPSIERDEDTPHHTDVRHSRETPRHYIGYADYYVESWSADESDGHVAGADCTILVLAPNALQQEDQDQVSGDVLKQSKDLIILVNKMYALVSTVWFSADYVGMLSAGLKRISKPL